MLVKQKTSYIADIPLLPLLIEKTTEQLAEKGIFFSLATDASNGKKSQWWLLYTQGNTSSPEGFLSKTAVKLVRNICKCKIVCYNPTLWSLGMQRLHLRILRETTLQIHGKSEIQDWLPVKCWAQVPQSVTMYVIGKPWCDFSLQNNLLPLTFLLSQTNLRI